MRFRLMKEWKGFGVMFRRSLGKDLGEDWVVFGIWGIHFPRKVGTVKKLESMSWAEMQAEAKELYSLVYVTECFNPRDLIRLQLLLEALRKRGWVTKESSSLSFARETAVTR